MAGLSASVLRIDRAMTSRGKALVASVQLPEPREVETLVIAPSKKDLGLAFKGDHKMVLEALMPFITNETLGQHPVTELHEPCQKLHCNVKFYNNWAQNQ
ncbi:glycine--tRNA ligase 1 [Carex littledalei]|uniref:Glycine--tRNA ligase 1 n=1 Tax=Carex littledalei TaxID=544730 RepID=A0A833R4L0_9POAL|nr:glycine--tRNA ligase 1 [Carex littledalei]